MKKWFARGSVTLEFDFKNTVAFLKAFLSDVKEETVFIFNENNGIKIEIVLKLKI